MDFMKKAEGLQEYMKEIRQTIHMYPELGEAEFRTGRLVMDELDKMGISYSDGIAKTGVLGLIRGGACQGAAPGAGGQGEAGGRTILLRADMDALPMQELNDSPYKSKIDGVMHACGHDVHTAMLLGAAKILSDMREELRGNVKLCFQPAEEAASGGAQVMVEEGILENPKVDFALALHVEPQFKIGSCGLTAGAITAFPDFFRFTFQGRGGHGSLPHLAADPIAPAVEAYQMLKDLKSKVDPLEPCVIQVCMLHGGTAPAVIPDECSMEGTVRVFGREAREIVKSGIERIAEAVSAVYGIECKAAYRGRCFSVVNDEAYTERVWQSIKGFYELGRVRNKDMGGEDFCFISDKVPSVYIPIGTSGDDPASRYPVHNPRFEVDERVFAKGAATLAKVAGDFLKGDYA